MPIRYRWLMVGGYICFGLVLFALFAFIKFPGQQVRATVLTILSHHGLEHLRIGTIQPLLPPGLAFHEVSLTQEVNGQSVELVRFPELRVYLRTLLPFSNPRRLRFEGELYGGSVLGTVEWHQASDTPTVGIRADLQGLRPGMHPVVTRLSHAAMEGTLMAAMTLQISSAPWQEGEGHLVLQGDVGSLSGLEVMGVKLPSLPYEQLAGEFALQTRSVIVRSFLIRGRDWQFDAQGKVGLSERLAQSTLDFTLDVRTSEALEQQLGIVGTTLKQRRDRRGFASFRIGGTLGHPTFIL
jgi:type II secretion system protein N